MSHSAGRGKCTTASVCSYLALIGHQAPSLVESELTFTDPTAVELIMLSVLLAVVHGQFQVAAPPWLSCYAQNNNDSPTQALPRIGQ